SQPQSLPPSHPQSRHPTYLSKPSDGSQTYPDPPSAPGHGLGQSILNPVPTPVPVTSRGQGLYPPQPVYPSSSLEPRYDDPSDPLELKRPRACEACRQLKVRCEPDASNPNGSCKRCAKTGRNCVVTVPTRKRQKKTDSRVAELERKIDALTASLQAKGPDGGGVAPVLKDSVTERGWPGGQPQEPSQGQENGLAGRKRVSTGEFKESTGGELESKQISWHRPPETKEPDVIEKGIVDVEVATAAFDRYVNDMAPQVPFVVFSPGTKMEDIRRTKPILLHAILSVAIGPICPSVQATLLHEFYKMIAEMIVMRGEKSLELVQAISVCWIWYMPPEHFEELKFYQLIHMAVIMGMDIGMNRRTMTAGRPFNLIRDLLGKKPSSLNPDAPETRRAWLGCYFGSIQVSVALRRVFLVRWHPYMDECIHILETSPDSLPSDKTLIHLVKLAHLTEDVGFQFSTDDTSSNISFSDTKVQYTLKAFEQQLAQWKKEIPPESYSPVMRQSEHILNIFMHETALQLDAAQTNEEISGPTSAAHINALTSCLTSIQTALEAICSLDVKTIICLPTVALARTSYAAIALIKLYSLASAPDSKVGQVIDPASLKVEYYLEKVINHYKVAGEQDGGHAPSKFSVVLSLLLSWFLKRKDQNPGLREAFGGTKPSTCMEDTGNRNERTKITTPLHLLSEVAMGNPSHQNTVQSRYPESTDLPISSTGESEPWRHHSQYPPVPGLSSSTTGPQRYYQYPQDTQPYQDLPGQPYTTATPDPSQTQSTQSNNPDMLVQGGNQTYFVPELGMQVGFYPENLFALGSMLDEGFFNLPFGGIGGEGEGMYLS
ncbi:Transcription factor, partial [Aspergillus sclerotialis]